jgi:hypothetical protein
MLSIDCTSGFDRGHGLTVSRFIFEAVHTIEFFCTSPFFRGGTRMVRVKFSANTFKRLHDQFISFGTYNLFEKEMIGDAKMILL